MIQFHEFYGKPTTQQINSFIKGMSHLISVKDAAEYINTGVLLRDAIINYISEINKTGIKVEAKFDGRIQING